MVIPRNNGVTQPIGEGEGGKFSWCDARKVHEDRKGASVNYLSIKGTKRS